MPKKFASENTKAVAARARKGEKAATDKEQKTKAAEDALWKDDDKSLKKKQGRKEDAEKKRLEALEKKRERDQLIAEEEKAEKSRPVKKGPKLSRAQIREDAEIREAITKEQNAEKEAKTHLETPIEENVNRLQVEGAEARTLDEAISVLSVKDSDSVDKHPEKRMKAAYEEFEMERMPTLKSENPTFRLSQLKQLLFKEWIKHTKNPKNMKLAALQEAES